MPIFIGGYARTGTTLVQGLICADEKTIPVTKECSYFRMLIQAYESALQIWDIHTDDYFNTHDEFTRFHKPIVDQYLSHIKQRWGADKIIVQKEPSLTTYFQEVDKLVPDSQFIVMLRDPRDCIASQIVRHMKAQGPKYKRDVPRLLMEYFQRYEKIIRADAALKDKLLLIPYESLVRNTTSVMQALREFTKLQLAIDPTEEGWNTKRSEHDESASSLDGKPVSDASVGKFRTVLTNEEINIIEQNRANLNTAFGVNIFLAD